MHLSSSEVFSEFGQTGIALAFSSAVSAFSATAADKQEYQHLSLVS